MSPSERFTNPSSKSDAKKTDGINDDAKKSAVLPTSNTPGTDSASSPKRGSERKQSPSDSSGKGSCDAAPKSSKHGLGFKAPAGKPANADNQH